MTALLLESTAAAVAHVREIGGQVGAVRTLTDDELLSLSSLAGQLASAAAAHSALIAGEIARRSDPTLGQAGLAQRTGHRTPIELIKKTASTTARDAASAMRVGLMMQDASPAIDPFSGVVDDPQLPWLAPVAAAVTAGSLSPAAAEAIGKGLGKPTGGVSVRSLIDAATALCASGLDPDRLFKRARQLRDELDAAGVADRERARHEKRSLTLRILPDDSGLITWHMDDETTAIVRDLYDRATSPRRGGPRFVDPTIAAQAEAIDTDERTTEQLASDVFAELLRHGADADSSQLLGTGAPVVRVLITEKDLRERNGIGWLEGQTDAVSSATANRLACVGKLQLATLDSFGRPLDLGESRRTFSAKQRAALATTFGGCAFPGCDRPPSWTEAHHIDWWHRDNGPTDIDNGILLCRHHHLLVHNAAWQIKSVGGELYFVPPGSVDPARTPMPAQRRDAAVQRLLALRRMMAHWPTSLAHPQRGALRMRAESSQDLPSRDT
jgi:hypothetical protein